MVEFLTKLLGPIFEPMGVSQADLTSYLEMVKGYIWVILGGLCLAILVMFLAHFAKKGKRHLVRWNAVLAFIALVAVVVNLICFGPLKSNVAGFLNASKAELSEETVKIAGAMEKVMLVRMGPRALGSMYFSSWRVLDAPMDRADST